MKDRHVNSTTRLAIVRLWELCRALRARRPHQRLNARQLGKQFGVCDKSIHRDIELLRDLGHDLVYDAEEYSYRYVCPPTSTYL